MALLMVPQEQVAILLPALGASSIRAADWEGIRLQHRETCRPSCAGLYHIGENTVRLVPPSLRWVWIVFPVEIVE